MDEGKRRPWSASTRLNRATSGGLGGGCRKMRGRDWLTLPTSALLSTLSATASGCFLDGDVMVFDRDMDTGWCDVSRRSTKKWVPESGLARKDQGRSGGVGQVGLGWDRIGQMEKQLSVQQLLAGHWMDVREGHGGRAGREKLPTRLDCR